MWALSLFTATLNWAICMFTRYSDEASFVNANLKIVNLSVITERSPVVNICGKKKKKKKLLFAKSTSRATRRETTYQRTSKISGGKSSSHTLRVARRWLVMQLHLHRKDTLALINDNNNTQKLVAYYAKEKRKQKILKGETLWLPATSLLRCAGGICAFDCECESRMTRYTIATTAI